MTTMQASDRLTALAEAQPFAESVVVLERHRFKGLCDDRHRGIDFRTELPRGHDDRQVA